MKTIILTLVVMMLAATVAEARISRPSLNFFRPRVIVQPQRFYAQPLLNQRYIQPIISPIYAQQFRQQYVQPIRVRPIVIQPIVNPCYTQPQQFYAQPFIQTQQLNQGYGCGQAYTLPQTGCYQAAQQMFLLRGRRGY